MISVEEQLLNAQNELLEYKKNELKNEIKYDELVERADFYEHLHNEEQKKLYLLEEKHKVLEEEGKALEKCNEDYKNEIGELKKERNMLIEKNIENISTKRLLCIICKRIKCKIVRR